MGVKLTLVIPLELEEEIEKITKGRYRSKQEFILECVRDKLKQGGPEK
jgi:Arc/MetJ-type ribon-helix-helix transcriptional regulator